MSAAVFEIVDPAKVPAYSVLEGNSSVYVPGSNKSLTFRFDGPLEKFMYLEIDGAVIPSVYYTLKEGSTIVTLNPTYLDQTEAGKHTITAHYNDGGRAMAVFEIQQKPSDSNNEGNRSGNIPSPEDKVDIPTQKNDTSIGYLPATGDTVPLLMLFGVGFVALGIATATFLCMRKVRSRR